MGQFIADYGTKRHFERNALNYKFEIGVKVLIKDDWGEWIAILLDPYLSASNFPCWHVEGERPYVPFTPNVQHGTYAVAEYNMYLILESNDILKELCSK